MENGPGDPSRVSVIVRTKDRPGLLREALDSLRAQTFDDFETIVVNDGDALDRASLEPPPGRRLSVVRPAPPGGRARALNAGLRASTGPYVAYLDDDDLFRPAHLEKLAGFLDGHPEVGAAFAAVEQVLQRAGPDGSFRDSETVFTFGRPFDANRILYKNDVPLIALMHRRDLPERAGPFDESFDLFEDWDFLIRLSRVTEIRYLPETTAVYRLRDDGSNATTAAPWRGTAAEAARRALFAKHASFRGPGSALALVDSLDDDVWRREEELRDLRVRTAVAEARAAQMQAELARTRDDAARELAAAAGRERELTRTLEAVYSSLWWRLATPWWKLRSFLSR